MIYPGLVVFDLDFTLWDCGGLWIDCTSYPFSKSGEGVITDSEGRRFRLYDGVPEVLDQLDALGISIGVASRTERPEWAVELLSLFEIDDRFAFREIYPGSKVSHFHRLASESSISLNEMVFFDDEERNIIEVGELGVQCHPVRNGLSLRVFEEALERFSEKF